MQKHEKPSIRTRIYSTILNKPIFRPLFIVAQKMNMIVFHWELRERRFKGRMKNDNTYYVYRGGGYNDIAGLISLYYTAAKLTYVAKNKNYIPYVDFKTYPCQYSVDRKINGSDNAWEYYFVQPCGTKRSDVINGKRIIISGWNFLGKKNKKYIDEWNKLSHERRKTFFHKNLPIIDSIEKEVQEFYDKEFRGKEVLGVFMRGTDYVANKPVNHSVQPTLDQANKKVMEFMGKYPIDSIFLVTEDKDYFDYFKSSYGERVFCSDYTFVRFDSKNDKWVKDSFHNDPYERGKNYLIRVMLLSKCRYFVGGWATGSKFALDFGDYKDAYVFDLGKY